MYDKKMHEAAWDWGAWSEDSNSSFGFFLLVDFGVKGDL